jgi:hypothetical protein
MRDKVLRDFCGCGHYSNTVRERCKGQEMEMEDGNGATGADTEKKVGNG